MAEMRFWLKLVQLFGQIRDHGFNFFFWILA